MSSAINGNGKESDKARTYGAIFINYHPYYYRGVAYLNLGKYEQAVKDFEQAQGVGEENMGSIETLMSRAKTKLEAASTPEPQPPAPVPQPRQVVPVPVPVQPAAPSMDPALRGRVQAAINAAQGSLASARNRKAGGSPQYSQAVTAVTEANTRMNGAHSNDDLNAALTLAQNASLLADAAVAPGEPAKPPVKVASVPPPRPVAASSMVMGDTTRRVRQALESYFRGDFEIAQDAFEKLSKDMPTNGWIYAFLGASQYSRYAFETDEKLKAAAMESFRKAKSLRTFRNGLPEKYFSKRIRRVFQSAS
jgi:tetratricopeptide (TPR) repeat protein